MSTDIKVPTLPESIADALIVTWHKKEGDPVKRDEVLVDVETDKVVLEVPAAEDGVLGKIVEDEGATVQAHQVIGSIVPAGAGSGDGSSTQDAPAADAVPADSADKASGTPAGTAGDAPDGGYGGATAAPPEGEGGPDGKTGGQTSPAVRKLLAKHDLSADDVVGTGRNGRISKEDVESHVARAAKAPAAKPPSADSAPAAPAKADDGDIVIGGGAVGEREDKRVPMTRLRARIAERLLSATQNTAMLTTFNEVDMSGFIELRSHFKDRFEKSHGVKLGFMSIFLKAATEALKRYPEVNASIDGSDIVYHGYVDIGVAVSSDRGLVVPVLRNTEFMGLADIEKAIGAYAVKARDGKLSIDEMTGGTFTVSNGGVFGSLLSTPILNPPQSAILGMHATQDRPIAVDGQVVIRPMMYVALSYDHRIVDGKGAVGFLKTIKELVEDPARIVLDV